MRKDFNEEFDLQIRQMMEGAQEPAPAGAWEAISSRLDALAASAAPAAAVSGVRKVTPSARPGRAWYWAGAALAMAASVALGIFLWKPEESNSNLININSSDALVAETAAFEVASTAAPDVFSSEVEKSPSVSETAVPVAVPAASREIASSTASEVASSTTPDVISSGVEKSPSAAETATVVEPQAAGSEKPAISGTTAATPDPFARMALEDARAKNRHNGVSAVLLGSMSNNNANSGLFVQAAPGAYAQSSISEKSQSNYGLPVTFGFGMRCKVNDMVSIGTGIDYSLLVRTFEGTYTAGTPVTGDIRHTVQYIGVPFDVFATLLKTNDLGFYANAGVELECAVSNKYTIMTTGEVVDGKVKGLQWSVGAGLGMEYALGVRTGLFVEPSVRYYFDCGQPKSIRTDKPFQLVLRAGLRFDL
jgi:hypothetical protein